MEDKEIQKLEKLKLVSNPEKTGYLRREEISYCIREDIEKMHPIRTRV